MRPLDLDASEPSSNRNIVMKRGTACSAGIRGPDSASMARLLYE